MIKTIQLVNCQSWRNGSFTLSPDKINVIIAKNDTGKSVLMKMLKISVSPKFYSPKKRKKLIRWGAQDARAYYQFTDGALAVVIVQQNAKVLYGFKEPNATKLAMSYDPPVRLVDELGMMVNSDGTFIANIIDTDQNLMLVDSDSKATCEFISMLCNNATLDEYKETLKMWQKDASDSLSTAEMHLTTSQYEYQKTEYVDVEKEEEKLNKMQIVKEVLVKLIDGARILNRLDQCNTDTIDFNRALLVTDALLKMESNSFGKLKVMSFNEHSIEIVSSLEKLETVKFEKLKINCKSVSKEANEILKILERLELTELSVFYIGKEPISQEYFRVLEKLENTEIVLNNIREATLESRELKKEIAILKDKFLKSGDVYKCPIYEEVIYDGEECIHDHY